MDELGDMLGAVRPGTGYHEDDIGQGEQIASRIVVMSGAMSHTQICWWEPILPGM